MSRRSKTNYEFSRDEDIWALKCMTCKHSYVTKDQSDELKCSCGYGRCNYENVDKEFEHMIKYSRGDYTCEK